MKWEDRGQHPFHCTQILESLLCPTVRSQATETQNNSATPGGIATWWCHMHQTRTWVWAWIYLQRDGAIARDELLRLLEAVRTQADWHRQGLWSAATERRQLSELDVKQQGTFFVLLTRGRLTPSLDGAVWSYAREHESPSRKPSVGARPALRNSGAKVKPSLFNHLFRWFWGWSVRTSRIFFFQFFFPPREVLWCHTARQDHLFSLSVIHTTVFTAFL